MTYKQEERIVMMKNIMMFLAFFLFIALASGCGRTAAADTYMMSVSKLEKLAAEGDTAAQYRIGYRYQHGEGVVEDKEKAAFFYEKAASVGPVRAMNNLGLMFLEGDGVVKDPERAWFWL